MNCYPLPFPDPTCEATYASPQARIVIGSEAHKVLFCRTLLDTFNPYRPAVLDWPMLDREARERLIGLPIWNIAVQTEAKASQRIRTYGENVRDPLLASAIALNAFEEGRHKHVLSNLVEAYGIVLVPEPDYFLPRDAEWAFMVTGYSECIDSFFAFGLFEAARCSGFFPPKLVDVFEPVMQEEGRHILFFVNWAAWHRRNLPWWRTPWFDLKRLAVWAFLVWERVAMVRSVNGETLDSNFTVRGASEFGREMSLAELTDLSLAEYDRRLGMYDRRLLRPQIVPALARFARRFMGKSARPDPH